MAVLFPINHVKLNTQMPRNCVQMIGCIGRAANCRVDRNRVFKSLARHDLGRCQILRHHFNNALARFISNLPALSIRRWDRGIARQAHAQSLGQ